MGTLSEGWQAVETVSLSELSLSKLMDGFLVQIKQAKIVRAVWISRC
jgi:hypothetical protein